MTKTIHAACAIALFALACGSAWGQASFGLSVSDSPDPVEANRPLTYRINVTNQTGFLLTDVFVTNRFSGPVEITGATNSRLFGSVFFLTNTVIFLITTFPGAGDFTELSVGVRPRAFGSLTNTITVGTFGLGITNATTNVVTQVIAGQPDLAIALRGPTQPVLVNDWMTYTLAAANVGGDAAPGVIVSNTLPDVKLIGIVPSNEVVTVNSNLLQWTIGSLGIGASRDLLVTVQPTNVGLAAFTAAISAPNVIDTNAVNDTATTNLAVEPLLTGSLVASHLDAMTFNPQTGLMEQTVRLTNNGTNAVPSSRIIVSDLTNRLYNAVGTNDGDPFVVYGATLPGGQSVDLLLEYFVPTRQPITVDNLQLHPFEMSAFNLTAPAGTPLPAPAPWLVWLSPGRVLLEFESTPGRTYTVLYRDGSIGSNEMAAQPSLVAPANRVQWIDAGPPGTIARPDTVSARFYRVIQNP